MDLAGPLLAGLFRLLFKRMTEDARKYIQKTIDAGRQINPLQAINFKTITGVCVYVCVCVCCVCVCVCACFV